MRIAPFEHIGRDYRTIFAPSEKRLVAARINTFALAHVGQSRHPCELLVALNEFLCAHSMQTSILTTFFVSFLGISHPLVQSCPVNRRPFGSGDRIVIYTDDLSTRHDDALLMVIAIK